MKEQLARDYAAQSSMENYFSERDAKFLKEVVQPKAFLAALNLELPMQDAPRDGSEILVKDGGMNKWRIAKWSEYHKGWKYSNHDLIGNPKCWRPL